MNLLFDHQIFDLQQYGGISRYFYELLRAYASAGEPAFEISCPYTTNAYLWEAPFLKLNTPFTRRHFKGSGVINNYLAGRKNRAASVSALKRGDYDLFHPTYYDPYFLEHLGDKPFVLTVYDMTHERYPECYVPDDQTSIRKRGLVTSAAHIMAISKSTKSDLVRLFKVSDEKVSVVGLGSSLTPALAVPVGRLPKRYLLYVGERGRYKNFLFMLRSLAPLLKDEQDLVLLAVGGGGFTGAELQVINDLGLGARCCQMQLAEAELATAYANAVALVFPSLCEGFGIPVLEAFACGCPAILSNRTALPEVGGEAALYFDPENEASLLQQVTALIADSSLREYLVAAGLKRSKEFSWHKCAMETASVYEKALGAGW